MSYAPSTFHAGTGTSFFENIGILGSTTGMDLLIDGRYAFPPLDDFDGTPLTITDSVAKAASAAATSWAGWNLSSAITKCLIVEYQVPSTAQFTGAGVHSGTLPTGVLEDGYASMFYPPGLFLNVGKYVATVWTGLGLDSTIYQDDLITAPAVGYAFYVDGSANTLQTFLKFGSTSQWMPVLSVVDSTFTSFQSVFLRHQGANCRYITPLMVWGS